MGKLNTEHLDKIKRERAESERQCKVKERCGELREALRLTPPTEDVAALRDRIEMIECILGIREPDTGED
jgi:predicted RNA-binding protein with PUA domain